MKVIITAQNLDVKLLAKMVQVITDYYGKGNVKEDLSYNLDYVTYTLEKEDIN